MVDRVLLRQPEWVIEHLKRVGDTGDFVMNMMRGWNEYKIKVLRQRKLCGYAAFRKLINDMKRAGLIEHIPSGKKSLTDRDAGTMFERSFYRVSRDYYTDPGVRNTMDKIIKHER